MSTGTINSIEPVHIETKPRDRSTMVPLKRRKVDGQEGSQHLTAFALRRQLLHDGGSTAQSVGSEPPPTSSSTYDQDAAAATPKGRISARVKGTSTRQKPIEEPMNNAKPQHQPQDSHGPDEPSGPNSPGEELSQTSKAPPTPPAIQQFSTFRPTKQNSRSLPGGGLQLKLLESERFLVIGSFGIRVLSGEVTIAGATLRPADETAWAHCALCHSIPVLRCSEDTKLELLPHPQAVELRRLDRLSPLFRGLWNEVPAAAPGPKARASKGTVRTFQIICTSEDAPPRALLQDLVSHPAWNKKLAEIVARRDDDNPPTVLVCGPKSSGKSTFGRLLGNRLLTSPSGRSQKRLGGFAVLDLDPGQPEYGPSGTIALVHVKAPNLSPPFTHSISNSAAVSVLRSHAIAATSPASDPELFLQSSLDLYHHFAQSSLRNRPLLINTPGWVQGTGLDLLTELASKIGSVEVIYMSEDGPADSVESLKAAAKGNITTLPSQQSEFTSRTAVHLRAMQSMVYFHTASDVEGTEVSYNATPLTGVPPIYLQYSGAGAGILAILSYEYQPPAELLVEAINGSVLAIVEIEDVKAFRGLLSAADEADGTRHQAKTTSATEMDVDDDVDVEMSADKEREESNTTTTISRTPEGIPFIPNPDSLTLDPIYSRSVGLVLVRGLDIKNKTLQLLSPVPLSQIEECRRNGRHLVLVHGKFDTPGWAYTEDSYARSFNDSDKPAFASAEITDADTDDDDSVDEPEDLDLAGDVAEMPWVEVLRGNQKRPVGSRVWRVRRDLGKGGAGD